MNKEQFTNIRAVIFDMDGLMIDSEPFHCQAFDKVFREFGRELTEEENLKYVGIADKDATKDMIERFKLPISAEDLANRKQKAYLEYLQEIVAQPGLQELLESLQNAGYKKAIASSSMLSEIEAVMNALTIRQYFETYCSAQQVEHGKPAPDVFLFAAEQLGIPAEQCLVLEDAPSGIMAARAAGMLSIAIPSRETMEKDFSGATVRLASLSEVFEYLPQSLI